VAAVPEYTTGYFQLVVPVVAPDVVAEVAVRATPPERADVAAPAMRPVWAELAEPAA
jgi:hypothetical protein